MNNGKITIRVEVILASGTTQQTLEWVIKDVVSWAASSYTGGYYLIKTEKEEEYRFPMERTILRVMKE